MQKNETRTGAATMKTNGHARNFTNPDTREGARLTVNLGTLVVVLRFGSWGDDALVTRAASIEEARGAWARYQSKALAAGFAVA